MNICDEVSVGDNESVDVGPPTLEYGTSPHAITSQAMRRYVYIIECILQLCVKADGLSAYLMEG